VRFDSVANDKAWVALIQSRFSRQGWEVRQIGKSWCEVLEAKQTCLRCSSLRLRWSALGRGEQIAAFGIQAALVPPMRARRYLLFAGHGLRLVRASIAGRGRVWSSSSATASSPSTSSQSPTVSRKNAESVKAAEENALLDRAGGDKVEDENLVAGFGRNGHSPDTLLKSHWIPGNVIVGRAGHKIHSRDLRIRLRMRIVYRGRPRYCGGLRSGPRNFSRSSSSIWPVTRPTRNPARSKWRRR